MSNNKTIRDLIRSFTGQENVLTIPRLLIELTGDVKIALFLSQCIYWSDRGKDEWFYKSNQEWTSEIGLTWFEINRARKVLETNGLLKSEVRRMSNGTTRCFYRVDMEMVSDRLTQMLRNRANSNSRNSIKRDSRNSRNLDTGIQETAIPGIQETAIPNPTIYIESETTIPETTTETTNQPGDWPDELKLDFLELGLGKETWPQIAASGWTVTQLAWLVGEINKAVGRGNVQNPGGLYLYRLKKVQPPKERSYTVPQVEEPEPDESTETEIDPDALETWQQAMAEYEPLLSPRDRDWLRGGRVIGYTNTIYTVYAINPMAAKELSRLLDGAFTPLLAKAAGEPRTVEIVEWRDLT